DREETKVGSKLVVISKAGPPLFKCPNVAFALTVGGEPPAHRQRQTSARDNRSGKSVGRPLQLSRVVGAAHLKWVQHSNSCSGFKPLHDRLVECGLVHPMARPRQPRAWRVRAVMIETPRYDGRSAADELFLSGFPPKLQIPIALVDNHDPGFVERGGAQFEDNFGHFLAVSARDLGAAGPNILDEDGKGDAQGRLPE